MLSKIVLAVGVTMCACTATFGFDPIKVELANDEAGKPLLTQPPTAGPVISRPANIVAGSSIKVENVEQFKGKAIVLKDASCMNFCFMLSSGKYLFHFEYLGMKSAGNSFFGVKNSKSEGIMTLMFTNDQTDIYVITDANTRYNAVLTKDTPAAFDVIIDLDAWTFSVDVNGKIMANGPLANKEKSLCYVEFSSLAGNNFAIKDFSMSKLENK